MYVCMHVDIYLHRYINVGGYIFIGMYVLVYSCMCEIRGRLPKFIKNFLTDRTFQVRIGSTLSD